MGIIAAVAAALGLALTLPGEERAPAWESSFEQGGFAEWSYSGGDEDDWGHLEVVPAREEGVPPLDGRMVARFEVTPEDLEEGRIHAKLYRSFYVGELRVDSRPPEDVSGTYSAWYYLPPGFEMRDADGDPDGWINILQFKNHYWVDRDDREEASDPLWWVELKSAAWARERGFESDLPDAHPVAWANHDENDLDRPWRFREVPLGRWFEVRAELHEGDRVELYVDGELLDVGDADRWPVSNVEDDPIGFTFGIGSYGPTQSGPIYADDVSYTPY